MPLQCAVVNAAQFYLAKLLLHSPLKGVKTLRRILMAPDDAEVITVL